MTVRSFAVPAAYMGDADATLIVDSDDGENARMTLTVGASVVACSGGFRRPEVTRWTWWDCPMTEIVRVFGSFLTAALESADDRATWSVLTEQAEDYYPALVDLAGPDI